MTSVDELERENEHLRRALITRSRIGIALGIAMERFALDEDTAFAYLSRISQTTNRKLADVAEEIVTTRTMPEPSVNDPSGDPPPDQGAVILEE